MCKKEGLGGLKVVPAIPHNSNFVEIITMYSVTHREWDFKDGLKLVKYDFSKLKLSLLPLNDLFNELTKKERSL